MPPRYRSISNSLPFVLVNRSRWPRVFRQPIHLLVAVLLAACSGGGSSEADNSSSSQADDSSESKSDASSEYLDTWVKVPAPEECMCADGSPYSLLVRKADPTKLAIVLGSGVICFSDDTCKRIAREQMNSQYFWGNVGILDFANSSNPFADYSVVFVPQCTLDQFLGNGPVSFPLTGEIFQVGNINATWAVQWAINEFPDAIDAVVIGTGTGGSGTTNMASLMAKTMPSTTIRMIIDSSGEFITIPYESFAKTHPEIRLARIYFANDKTRNELWKIPGQPPLDGMKNILDGEQRIETAGPPVSTWIHPGEYHSALNEALFFEMQQNGVSLIDWLQDFLDLGEVPDRICVACDT